MTALQLHLRVGGQPAPADALVALDKTEITVTDQAPSVFQLRFTTERTSDAWTDAPLLASGLFAAGTSLQISVTLGTTTAVLMDGYVTHVQMLPSAGRDPAQILVTGEDLSVQMDLHELSLEYPAMPDAAIAEAVLAKWLALGIVPHVVPSPSSLASLLTVPQQVGSDRQFLKYLADQHAYVFCIRPGSALGRAEAYWGPPPYDDPPQPVLSVDSGTATNVTDLRFGLDALAPRYVTGLVLDPFTEAILPVASVPSTRNAMLASRPALVADLPFVRTTLFDHQGLDVPQSLAKAQAITNASTDRVVTGDGSLDALRYGHVLRAPGVVPVRGAGTSFDGLYYCAKVTHCIDRHGYKQSFSLQRDGLGSTISSVPGA